MIGIDMSWECPSCGNVLHTQHPFQNNKMRKAAASAEPEKCGCGRKEKFKLLGFRECTFRVELQERRAHSGTEIAEAAA